MGADVFMCAIAITESGIPSSPHEPHHCHPVTNQQQQEAA